MISETQTPIIIIGMHRSGTSMISQVLEEMGVHMGSSKEVNSESKIFLSLNRWLFGKCAASWDYPGNMTQLYDNKKLEEIYLDYIESVLNSPILLNYLGIKKYITSRNLNQIDIPWGWKDPRNTYTLPLWLKLFPNAKVIHVFRHGVDVAVSLKVRQEKALQRVYEDRRSKHFYWLARMFYGKYGAPLSCDSLDGGVQLWEQYTNESIRQISPLIENERGLAIKYEKFLEEPRNTCRELAKFCNLSHSDKIINSIAEKVDHTRGFAYKNNPELVQYEKSVKDRLAVLGY